MNERPIYKEVSAADLTLSKTNPRFPKPVSSEAEAILTFFRLKKVGEKKIKAIIQDIIETGVVLEDFIVLHIDNEYVVHDGNRRLTALKLLMDNNSEIIRAVYPKTYRFIEQVKHSINVKNLILSAKVYTHPESMANHVIKIHSGEQLGAGQINWDSNETDTFSKHYFDKPLNTGNLIYKLLENTPNKKTLYDKIKDEAYTTTFDRIFNFSDIKTRIFNLGRGIKIDLDDPAQFSKVCEMVEYFISKGANVGAVYTAEMASNFFAEISPITSPNDSKSDEKPNSGLKSGAVSENENEKEKEKPSDTEKKKETDKPVSTVVNDDEDINEKQPYELIFKLKSNKKNIHLYNDFNLFELIEVATDSDGENLEDKVRFNSESSFIRNNIFSGDAPSGIYIIQAKLENNEHSISKSVEIRVVLPRKKIKIDQAKNEFFKSIAAFTEGEVKININNTVDMLIMEIQSIENAQDYRYMIASSVRQLLELSIDKVIKEKGFTNHGNPKQNLNFLIGHMAEKKLLNQICKGENKLKFQAIKNFLGSIQSDKLYDYLNLITHDSYATAYDELVERVNLEVTPILIVFHNYLKLE